MLIVGAPFKKHRTASLSYTDGSDSTFTINIHIQKKKERKKKEHKSSSQINNNTLHSSKMYNAAPGEWQHQTKLVVRKSNGEK